MPPIHHVRLQSALLLLQIPSFFVLFRGESGAWATEVSITATTLSVWPNGDESGWHFAKWAVLSSGAEWKWGETREEEIGGGGGVGVVYVGLRLCVCLDVLAFVFEPLIVRSLKGSIHRPGRKR